MPTQFDIVTVYVVTGTLPGAERDAEGNRLRREIGKFFKQKDAEDFASQLHDSWIQARVEPRTERAEDQHPAHQAQGKAKAAWE